VILFQDLGYAIPLMAAVCVASLAVLVLIGNAADRRARKPTGRHR
jgi:hypothetical protein